VGNRTYYTQLRIDPLGRESAEEMLDALLGAGPELAAPRRLIIDKTEGNPFFMEETVQALFDEGALLRNGKVKLTRPLGELKIPPTVQAILAARIDRLPPVEKELLQTLAVIGQDLALELIKEVTGKREEQLDPMLTNLQVGEFIYEQPSIAGREYTFKHALTQEVAYNSLLAERRRMIHEQTARSIEQLFAHQLEDHWSGLTHHYLRGIDAEKAMHFARLAAEQAISRSAFPEAISITEAALALLEKIPDGPQRIRAELALRNVEWALVYVTFGASSAEVERVALRMCELGEEIGRGDELVGGLLPLTRLYLNRGEPLRGLALAKRCLTEATQDPRLLAEVRGVVGTLAFGCGSLREAVSNFEDLAVYVEQTDPKFFIGPFPGRIVRPCLLALPMQLLGRVSEAAKLVEEGARRARESKHLYSLGFVLAALGGRTRLLRREPEIAMMQTEEAIALCEENGFAATWLHWGHFYRGWALAELGQPDQGIAEMEKGVAGSRRIGGVPFRQYAVALLAHTYARTGRAEEGLTLLNEALERIEHTGEKVDQSEMLRLKAEVLLMRDSAATAEAEHCLRAALQVAHQQEAKWWELRTTVSLARLLRNINRRDEASAMLAEIYGWFTEGFDTADLKDAKALLDELSV
jgi:predicted ATPase